MWPIQLAFHLLISCRIFLCSLTLSNTSPFLTRSVQLFFSVLLQHHISKLSSCFRSTARTVPVSAPHKAKMCDDMVEPDWPQMSLYVIRRMRIVCRMTKATDTHSECVTLIAFPREQWLRERWRNCLVFLMLMSCKAFGSDMFAWRAVVGDRRIALSWGLTSRCFCFHMWCGLPYGPACVPD